MAACETLTQAKKEAAGGDEAVVVKTINLNGGWVKQILKCGDGKRQYPKFINPDGGPSVWSLSKAEAVAKMELSQ